ncbi:hypothetical protein [Streptomyces sp. NBC_01602]|uniref:hypothetical protein n=1 Tax=Streptomyces sp. NBC_01602 TaxID=2975893 RepID=UPI00387038A9|nr:hypothetical protein OG955_00070 [Streptomyces sp. NBC_01602]
MAGDRDLKFQGYEVFRFGHDELRDRDRSRTMLSDLRMHPPLHLRRWFARRAPLPLPASGHPLTTTPGITPAQAGPGQ